MRIVFLAAVICTVMGIIVSALDHNWVAMVWAVAALVWIIHSIVLYRAGGLK